MTPTRYEKTEAETREEIDAKLILAGWVVQDKAKINLHESLSIAVREIPTSSEVIDFTLRH